MATPRKTPTRSAAKGTTAKPAARKPAAPRTTAKPKAKKAVSAAPARRTGHSAGFASIGALAVAALGAVAFGAWRLLRRPSEGTEPTDLMGDEHPDGSARAIPAFRPDPTAPVSAAEREQFRPALAQVGNTVS